jgi:hypothetical protein
MILPIVLYGRETCCLTLREGHRLRVFEKRDEVMGGWKKLHDEELRDLYSPPSIIRMQDGQGMKNEWGEDECISYIGGKAKRKETTRKTKT